MISWLSPPSPLPLADNEIHVWKVDLNSGRELLPQFFNLLSHDEQQRAAKFHFEKDKRHFCVARGLLRVILSSYLCEHPQDLIFHYNAYGKPMLALEHHHQLRFNLSHSHGLALYAVVRHCNVGVDLERVRTDIGWQQIVAHFFSAQERRVLTQLPEHQQCKAFFDGWTRKEAYIKAKGQGLSIPLDQFDVSLNPDEPAALLSTPDPEETAQWTIHSLVPAENYTSAIAVQGKDHRMQFWQGPPQGWG